MQKADCIFCKIANGEIPSKTIYENKKFRVILDLNPVERGHALILPKNHAENLYDLPADTAAEVLAVAKEMAVRMKRTLGCKGLNLVQNNEKSAGQTVMHFHMHLIPRYGEEESMDWTPKEMTQEELEKVRVQMTEQIQ